MSLALNKHKWGLLFKRPLLSSGPLMVQYDYDDDGGDDSLLFLAIIQILNSFK